MFMTDDAIPKDQFLIENLLKSFENPSVSAAYGRQIADPKKITLNIIRGSLIIQRRAGLRQKRIFRHWALKLFSVLMSAAHTGKKHMMPLEDLFTKQFLMKT